MSEPTTETTEPTAGDRIESAAAALTAEQRHELVNVALSTAQRRLSENPLARALFGEVLGLVSLAGLVNSMEAVVRFGDHAEPDSDEVEITPEVRAVLDIMFPANKDEEDGE